MAGHMLNFSPKNQARFVYKRYAYKKKMYEPIKSTRASDLPPLQTWNVAPGKDGTAHKWHRKRLPKCNALQYL